MKKEKLLVRKSALEKMLSNLNKLNNNPLYNIYNLRDYVLYLLELSPAEYEEIDKLLEKRKDEYTYGESVGSKKSWLLIEIIKVDKKLRRKEKLSNFFGAIKGLFTLNKMLKIMEF